VKLYLAGNTAVVQRERVVCKLCNYRLLSYWHILPGAIQFQGFEWLKKELRKNRSDREK